MSHQLYFWVFVSKNSKIKEYYKKHENLFKYELINRNIQTKAFFQPAKTRWV